MADKEQSTAALTQIIESARHLGVEIDEEEALQWLSAMAVQDGESDVVVDERTGVFGHKVTMLDFSPEDLAYFRQIGRLVEFYDEPGVVETALALSGSAAQSSKSTCRERATRPVPLSKVFSWGGRMDCKIALRTPSGSASMTNNIKVVL